MQYLSNYWSDLPQILNLGLYDQRELCKCFKWRRPHMEDDLKWKTTSIIKSVISQQLLVGSSPNLNLGLYDQREFCKCFKWRRPQMEDDLKWKTTSNIKSEISQQLLAWSSQSLNLGLCDQSKLYKCFKWRRPTLEDELNWKITSNIKSGISQQLLVGSSQNVILKRVWPKQSLQMPQMKTTPNKFSRPFVETVTCFEKINADI